MFQVKKFINGVEVKILPPGPEDVHFQEHSFDSGLGSLMSETGSFERSMRSITSPTLSAEVAADITTKTRRAMPGRAH